jgi:hypothetical protein
MFKFGIESSNRSLPCRLTGDGVDESTREGVMTLQDDIQQPQCGQHSLSV